jgi:diacylglycerol O-acyltransferase
MRRAGPLDAAFLGLEAPGHPMHMMAVIVLDPSTVPGGYSFPALSEYIASRLPGIPPLRQRLVPTPMGLAAPGWVDSQVDMEDHVFKEHRPAGTLADVASYAAAMATTPLDPGKPLWSMHVVDGLEDGAVAVVAKVHHALMDGVGGMGFLASMFSLQPAADPVVEVGGGAERAPRPVTMLVRAMPEVLATPVRISRALVETGRVSVRLYRAIRTHGRPPLPRPPRLRWNGELGGERTMALASLPIAEVKAVAHATRTTVNDVALSVFGGGCRAYLTKCGELPGESLVAIVPVSTRGSSGPWRGDRRAASGGGRVVPQDRANEPANAVSVVLSSLGTDVADPLQRLAVVHGEMVGAKHLQDALGPAIAPDWVATICPLAVTAVSRIYLGTRAARYAPLLANVLVSNVAGPPVPLFFGGARVTGLYPLGPVYDGIGLNVTIVSGVDTVDCGFVSSPRVIDDLDALVAAIDDEFAAMKAPLDLP